MLNTNNNNKLPGHASSFEHDLLRLKSTLASVSTKDQKNAKTPVTQAAHDLGMLAIQGNADLASKGALLQTNGFAQYTQYPSSPTGEIGTRTLGINLSDISAVNEQIDLVVEDYAKGTLKKDQLARCQETLSDIASLLDDLEDKLPTLPASPNENNPIDPTVRVFQKQIERFKDLCEKIQISTQQISIKNLFAAVDQGDIATIIQAIEEGFDLTSTNNQGESLLCSAAEKGQLEVCQLLTQHPKARETRLLEKGDDNGTTPLGHAIIGGHLKVCKFLISVGANVKAIDNLGYRTLDFAAFQGSVDIAKLLIKHGAVVTDVNKNQETPLFSAIREIKNIEMCKFLINAGVNLKQKDIDGCTILHAAASGIDSPEICCTLLNAGMEVDILDDDGKTPLHHAADYGNLKNARVFINAGANVNHVDADGCTALHLAALEGSVGTCRLLVQNKAEVDALNNNGQTPLHYAALSNNPKACKYLIDVGADINRQNAEGFTPLHSAASIGSDVVCTFLVAHGANTEIKSNEGFTAFTLAKLKRSMQNIKECFASSMTNFLHDYDKDVRYRLALSHSFQWSGMTPFTLESTMETTHELDLGGAFIGYFLKKFSNSFVTFHQKYPKLIDAHTSELISSCCAAGASGLSIPAEDKVKAWKNNLPVLLNTGYEVHHISVLVWDNILIFCDRSGAKVPGKEVPGKVFSCFNFNGELTEDIVNKVEGLKSKTQEETTQCFNNTLPALLDYNSESEFTIGGMKLPYQVAENCTWANGEGIVLATQILNACKMNEIDPSNADNKEIAAIVKKQIKIFQNWQSYQKLIIAQKYLRICQQESNRLFIPDWLLLGKSIAEGFVQCQQLGNGALDKEWRKAVRDFNGIAPEDVRTIVTTALFAQPAINRTIREKTRQEGITE